MAQSSNYAAILAKIAEMLGSVIGIGNVHARKRMTHDWTAFLAAFKVAGEDKLLGWSVSRRTSTEKRLTQFENVRVHKFVIQGFRGLDDSANTEDEFQDLIELICDRYRDDYNIEGTAEFSDPIQVVIVDDRRFGSVLCHYGELTIEVTERLTGGS